MAWTKDDLDLNKYSIASGAFGGPIGDLTLIRAVFWDRFAVLCSTGVAVALVRDEKKIVLLGAQSLKPTIQAWLTQRSQRGQFYSAARLLFADFYVGGGPYGFLAVEVRRYTVCEKLFARGRVRSVLLCSGGRIVRMGWTEQEKLVVARPPRLRASAHILDRLRRLAPPKHLAPIWNGRRKARFLFC